MWKLKHANSILETFEYFCQISSKLILIIFSYTVSKLVRFFETLYFSDYWLAVYADFNNDGSLKKCNKTNCWSVITEQQD